MEIELPDGTVLEAPDNADPSAVARAYLAKQRKSVSPEPAAAQAPDAVSAFMRPVIKAVSGLPGMMADAGVGVRNLSEQAVNRYAPNVAKTIYGLNRKLAGNSDVLASILPGGPPAGNYEGLTPQFNRSIDQFYAPPATLPGKVAEGMSTTLLGSRMPAPEISNPAPNGFMPPAQALKNSTLEAAGREGYVIPPSSNNPTATNRVLEGIAGKAKLTQEAMMRNQPVTEGLAARALGQNPDAPLTQEALATIRADAHATGYEPVRQAGEIATDAAFTKALDSITKAAKGASRSFPGLKPKADIADTVDALRQSKFDAGDGIDAIAHLRSLADDAYSSGEQSAGRAYKAAAKAVEDVIERDLASRGKDAAGLLKGYKDARQLIAQTYTAGKALTDASGTSNALSYGRELIGKTPLVGDQRTIGRFASQFGKFAKVPIEIYPSISPLDVYGSAISTGVTGSAAPLALPLSRVALREYLLSPQGQRLALRAAYQAPTTIGMTPSFMAQVPGLMAGP